MADSPTDPVRLPRLFVPERRYRLLAALGALMTLAFLWLLSAPLRAGDRLTIAMLISGESFFVLVSLGLALWFARQGGAVVEVDPQALTLRMPLARPRRVEYRQLVSVATSERGGRSLILLYHPSRDDGLLDLESVHSLGLPALIEQEALQDFLEERMP